MLIASAVALGASLILSAETLQLARHPESALGCDLNSVVSCSAVAQSWQAEIAKFGGLSYPNAFFGIAAESVFITIAVIGLARVKVPRWFATCTWLGGLAALAYSYWLSTQSLFVIHALCPWCLLVTLSTTLVFSSLTHVNIRDNNLFLPPRVQNALASGLRMGLDGLIVVLWLTFIALAILLKYGAALFA